MANETGPGGFNTLDEQQPQSLFYKHTSLHCFLHLSEMLAMTNGQIYRT